jgi:hypothetical protein
LGRSREELNALCERAAKHKRSQLAEQGHSAFKLQAWVYHATPFAQFSLGPDGWVRLSTLRDGINSQTYVIWWEPATDRLRLQRVTE